MLRAYFSLFSCLSVFLVLVFSACTGTVTGTKSVVQKPMDGDLIQGKTEKAFYASLSSKSGSVLLLDSANHSVRLFHISNGKVLDRRDFNSAELVVSEDGSALVANSEKGIFEANSVSASSVLAGTTPFPDPTLDALCFPAPFGSTETVIGGTQFKDFRIANEKGAYAFTGMKNGRVEGVGGSGTVTAQSLLSERKYLKSGFGSVHVYRTIPHQSNPNFLYTAFEIETGAGDSAFGSTTNLFCSLNPSVLGIDPSAALLVAGGNEYTANLTAKYASAFSGGMSNETLFPVGPISGSWFSQLDGSNNGPYASIPVSGYTNYFNPYDFRAAVPMGAKITKISAQVTTRQGTAPCFGLAAGVREEGIYIYNKASGQMMSGNASHNLQVSSSGAYTTNTYTILSGPVTGPGVLTPQFVNSADFGLAIRYYNDTTCAGNSVRIGQLVVSISYVE